MRTGLDGGLVAFLATMAVLALIVLVAGCSTAPPSAPGAGGSSIGYYHDAQHGVSCWTFGNGGGTYTAAISCLPDAEVENP